MPTETIPLRKPEDSHDGPAPARRFGPYQIVRKLGRSMTDVYLARDTRNERLTVLKIVEESNDPYTQQVLVAERRGAAIQKQLHDFDPRFVEIYDYGQLENAFYVAMEYVDGRSIADLLLESGRIDPQSAARIAMEICSQLEKLHSHQAEIDGRRRAIVHGDIKPSNVQMTPSGQVRLLDFGIAKVISLTRNVTHHDLGSPNYCSPERLASARVDQNADLWATGISLYEMVSGSLPYQAENTRKLENLIRSKRPPRQLPPDCPERLAVIIRKSLASDIKRRYLTASAFAADLECFLNGRPTIAESELRNTESNPTIESVRIVDHALAADDPPSEKDALWQTLLSVRVPKSLGRYALAWGGKAWMIAAAGGLLLAASGARYYYPRWREAAPLRAHTSLAQLSDAQIKSDWELLEQLQKHDRWLGKVSPARFASKDLKAAYVAEGKRIIDSYSNSPEQDTNKFDWKRAQTVLEHAQELDRNDPAILGELALVKGYVFLNLAGGPQVSVEHMHDQVSESWRDFDQAASLLPKEADPHLGLARLYVYSYRLLDEAIEEWDKAEQRHYKLGPREIEQKADGFSLRAEKEMSELHDRDAAKTDLARAKELYKSIAGYDDVAQRLQVVAQDERNLNPPRVVINKPPVNKAPAKKTPAAKSARPIRRTQTWQSPKAGKKPKS